MFCFSNKQANFLKDALLKSKRKDTLITLQEAKITSLEKEVSKWEALKRVSERQLDTYKLVSNSKDAQISELQKQVTIQTKRIKKSKLKTFVSTASLSVIIIFLLFK